MNACACDELGACLACELEDFRRRVEQRRAWTRRGRPAAVARIFAARAREPWARAAAAELAEMEQGRRAA